MVFHKHFLIQVTNIELEMQKVLLVRYIRRTLQ